MNHANQPNANGDRKALKEPTWNMMYCFASDDEETESSQTAASAVLTSGRHDIPRSVVKRPEPTWNMMYCFSSDDEENEAVVLSGISIEERNMDVMSDVVTEKHDVSPKTIRPTTATTNEEARSTCNPEVAACVRG